MKKKVVKIPLNVNATLITDVTFIKKQEKKYTKYYFKENDIKLKVNLYTIIYIYIKGNAEYSFDMKRLIIKKLKHIDEILFSIIQGLSAFEMLMMEGEKLIKKQIIIDNIKINNLKPFSDKTKILIVPKNVLFSEIKVINTL